MSIKALDGNRLADMIRFGANHLSANADIVDKLNVFPVPDGDTGTNMNLSMTSGSKEVYKNRQEHIGKVAAAFSRGLLMGARGNSGVILSQLFRGFSKNIESKQSLSSVDFAEALDAGVQTAYKAVMKPVEGTILTVAKDAARKAVEIAEQESDLIVVMEETLREAKASLQRTPDLLPVLKEVGVVDSGGQGLVYVYEGFLAELKGEEITESHTEQPSMEELVNAQHHQSVQSFMSTEEIEFGYCTEFMVRFEEDKQPFSEDTFRNELSQFGDSLLVISDDDLVKVHIHAEHPGEVLSYGQKYGSLINMKIENMREQHSSIVGQDHQAEMSTVPHATKEHKDEKREYALIAVSMGSGIADLFKSIGVTEIIEGGQTMNPSTEDIIQAINKVNAEKIIVLPNNKNIIMAAEQAAEIAEADVVVIPSVTVPQGLVAALAFNPSYTLEQNAAEMKNTLAEVQTGLVTFAVRDTQINGLSIAENDFMGIKDGDIVEVNHHMVKAACNLLTKMIDEDTEILTVLYGEDTEETDVKEIEQFIEENFEDIEVEIINGNQPLYNFIFSVE